MSTARPATSDDIPEVVRMGALMFESMGQAVGGPWREVAEAALAERLGDTCAAFVVDDPGVPGRVVASAAVSLHDRLPSPSNPTGCWGYVQYVATDPGHRRRGHARAVMEAVLAWLDERGVTAAELHATPEGAGLYTSLGFGEGPNPSLRR
ncbi:MAG TPA: GNAT family N-acetyltransferase, partial [Acidimicrobiia bacterium]|nr:GNAT family N-acetyltransferase [Acidimicrobiia bacterium]